MAAVGVGVKHSILVGAPDRVAPPVGEFLLRIGSYKRCGNDDVYDRAAESVLNDMRQSILRRL